MLAFEADELHRIVDLMRDLRASGPAGTSARRSRSTPAGRRGVADLVAPCRSGLSRPGAATGTEGGAHGMNYR